MSPRHPADRVSSVEALNRATVADGFVAGLLAGARARGLDLRALGATGAPRVPIADYAALYNRVVEAMDDEAFGLFASPLPRGTFELLCRSVLSSHTLGEALDRSTRFMSLALAQLDLRLRREDGRAILQIAERRALQRRRNDPRRVFAFEWLLRLLHGLACWLAGRGLTLDEVHFPYAAPAHAPEYARIYTERSVFGAKTLAARFDETLLALPVRRDEADLAAFLEGAPGKISMLYRRDREMARAVRECLGRDLAAAPSFAETARRLHLSPRTLHRRLSEEGSSFRAIKDALRRDEALARLGRDQASVAQTAAALGYSEPSAFFRAFQGWTGEAPSVYRRRNSTR